MEFLLNHDTATDGPFEQPVAPGNSGNDCRSEWPQKSRGPQPGGVPGRVAGDRVEGPPLLDGAFWADPGKHTPRIRSALKNELSLYTKVK
ncbi:MAG: hypothetical protein IPG57_22135 [Burkholderiales bacterium]|jgi:hypothetical protein|nr:hypothetical protein [Burkholderiales bacterium]MBP7520333.1 hypothetical protein [Leptothrix sp. (in: b-proteobacteria)]HQY07438.1 hypothetical protein [Burkholderiaceae bacterium]